MVSHWKKLFRKPGSTCTMPFKLGQDIASGRGMALSIILEGNGVRPVRFRAEMCLSERPSCQVVHRIGEDEREAFQEQIARWRWFSSQNFHLTMLAQDILVQEIDLVHEMPTERSREVSFALPKCHFSRDSHAKVRRGSSHQ
mmetsp:Transcript_1594/g.9827  ORF Transcript_1594/g.9827 Transcript_1594/m.9827 type:complete len:142 (-) Transcript_1594:1455-1880(-)